MLIRVISRTGTKRDYKKDMHWFIKVDEFSKHEGIEVLNYIGEMEHRFATPVLKVCVYKCHQFGDNVSVYRTMECGHNSYLELRAPHAVTLSTNGGNLLASRNKCLLRHRIITGRETSKPWVSKLFMAKGHARYCGLVREPHVGK
jgi:hypothetical protein